MNRPTSTVARYVLIEARRSALPWLATASVLAALGLAGFLSKVAITEASALQASVCAALLRACAVFLVAMHVIASVVREANDKGLELALAFPLPLPAWAKSPDLAAWALALAAETAVIAAAALFFATALGQTVAAIAAVL